MDTCDMTQLVFDRLGAPHFSSSDLSNSAAILQHLDDFAGTNLLAVFFGFHGSCHSGCRTAWPWSAIICANALTTATRTADNVFSEGFNGLQI